MIKVTDPTPPEPGQGSAVQASEKKRKFHDFAALIDQTGRSNHAELVRSTPKRPFTNGIDSKQPTEADLPLGDPTNPSDLESQYARNYDQIQKFKQSENGQDHKDDLEDVNEKEQNPNIDSRSQELQNQKIYDPHSRNTDEKNNSDQENGAKFNTEPISHKISIETQNSANGLPVSTSTVDHSNKKAEASPMGLIGKETTLNKLIDFPKVSRVDNLRSDDIESDPIESGYEIKSSTELSIKDDVDATKEIQLPFISKKFEHANQLADNFKINFIEDNQNSIDEMDDVLETDFHRKNQLSDTQDDTLNTEKIFSIDPISTPKLKENSLSAQVDLGHKTNSYHNRANILTPYRYLPLEIGLAMIDGRRSLQLQLSPESLGKLDISLDISNGSNLVTRITADDPKTLAFLKSDSHTIRQAIEQAGYTLKPDDLQFSLRQEKDQNQSNQSKHDGSKNPNTNSKENQNFSDLSKNIEIDQSRQKRTLSLLDLSI